MSNDQSGPTNGQQPLNGGPGGPPPGGPTGQWIVGPDNQWYWQAPGQPPVLWQGPQPGQQTGQMPQYAMNQTGPNGWVGASGPPSPQGWPAQQNGWPGQPPQQNSWPMQTGPVDVSNPNTGQLTTSAASAPVQTAQQPFVTPTTAASTISKSNGNGGLVGILVVLIALLLVAVVVLALGLLGILRIGGTSASSAVALPPTDVALVAADVTGTNVFRTTAVEVPTEDVLVKPADAAAPGTVDTVKVTEAAGDADGVYGTGPFTCRLVRLSTDLAAAPAAAAIWIAALNADTSLGWGSGPLAAADIEAYTANLYGVYLLADTRVTEHQNVSGADFPIQTVLQKGTAVGVDRYGVPRVRCSSGNPLTAPVAIDGATNFTGAAWSDFSADKLATITPSSAPITTLSLAAVGTSNVTTLTATYPACEQRTSCPAPGPGVTFEPDPDLTSFTVPVVDGCSTDPGVDLKTLGGPYVRIVNDTAANVIVSYVDVPAYDCGSTAFFFVAPGGTTYLTPDQEGNFSGALYAFSDGTSETASATLPITDQNQLYVLK